MTTGNSVFQIREGSGWSRGLDNLLDAELGCWFRTKKWWIQILVWAALVNLILFVVVLSEDGAGSTELAMTFIVLLSVFSTFGVAILMQGAIVGEMQSGTAAWVLSKPVARPAFVLAKLIANTVGIAFTLMLGTIFSRRGPVIAIPLVFLFVEELILGLFPVLAHVLPWTLSVPLDNSQYPSVAIALMTGTEPLTYLPLATTLGASILFVAAALWIFERREF